MIIILNLFFFQLIRTYGLAVCAVLFVSEVCPIRKYSNIKYYHQLHRMRTPGRKVYLRYIAECIQNLGFSPAHVHNHMFLYTVCEASKGCTKVLPYPRNSSSSYVQKYITDYCIYHRILHKSHSRV